MNLRVTKVSGDYVQGSFGLLPLAGERARAALYFSGVVGSKSFDGNLELARWYLRAALSEFRSIFDLVGTDFKSLGLAAQWKRSPQRALIDADPIVSVLRKVRDFVIHSALIVGEAKTFKVVSSQRPAAGVSDMPAIVIEPLDRVALASYRGKDELSQFDENTLSAFNEHARRWPADMLVHIAVYRTSEPLAVFLAANRKNESLPAHQFGPVQAALRTTCTGRLFRTLERIYAASTTG
jgi:hypothetical protein